MTTTIQNKHRTHANKHRTEQARGSLHRALHARLLSLPFDGYLKVVVLLLAHLGYRDVRLAGRTDWKGRNKGGGFDLVATVPGGLSSRKIVVQAKQFDVYSRVFQRQADELRGVAIRSEASEALLITSGPLSKSIDLDALAFPLAPVRLIGGDQLLTLLIQNGIGIDPNGALDEAFFSALEREAIGNRQADCLGAGSQIHVRVEVRRVPRREPSSLS